MRPSFPHQTHDSTTSRSLRPCGDQTLVASMLIPSTTQCHGGGMGHRSRLESVSIPSLGDGWVDRHTSFSLLSYLSIYYFLYGHV